VVGKGKCHLESVKIQQKTTEIPNQRLMGIHHDRRGGDSNVKSLKSLKEEAKKRASGGGKKRLYSKGYH